MANLIDYEEDAKALKAVIYKEDYRKFTANFLLDIAHSLSEINASLKVLVKQGGA